MKTVRVVASFLYQITKLLGFLYLLLALYGFVTVMLFKSGVGWAPMNINTAGAGTGSIFEIYYPFTRSIFLRGEYISSYMIIYFISILFYGLFLLFLSGVFKAFKQKRLFTQNGFQQLNRFFWINLAGPILILLVYVLYGESLNDILKITLLHLVIALFAFFMAAIFKQGLFLQEEQDLIL